MKPWDGIISQDEQSAYRAAGFGRPSGLGERPALLIIDVQYRTTGTDAAAVLGGDQGVSDLLRRRRLGGGRPDRAAAGAVPRARLAGALPACLAEGGLRHRAGLPTRCRR